MANLADLLVKVGIDAGAFTKGVRDLSDDFKSLEKEARSVEKSLSGFDKVGARLTGLGQSLTVGLTLPLGLAAGAALGLAANFEAAFQKVQALGDNIVGPSLERLRQQAIKLGADTKFSAQEAAEGMAVFASAGFNAEQIYAVMPGTLNLAAAGMMEVNAAAELTNGILGQFQLTAAESGRVADVMAQAMADTSSSATQLGDALTYAGPVAHSAGQSLEETTAAIMALDKAAIRGSQAGTGLRGVLGSLIDPSKEAQKALDIVGVSMADATGKIKPLSQVMEEFKQGLAQVGTEAERQKLVFQVFGREAGAAAQVLINTGGPALDAFEQKLLSSGGAAEKMAKTMNTGLKPSLDQLKGSVETAAIVLGTQLLPIATRLADSLTSFVNDSIIPMIQWFGKLPGPVQATALALVGLAAAAGPVIFIAGQLASSVSSIGGAIAGAQAAMVKFPAVANLVSGAMTTMAFAAAGLVVALALKDLGEELVSTAEKIELNFEVWGRLKGLWETTDATKPAQGLAKISDAAVKAKADTFEFELAWARLKAELERTFSWDGFVRLLTGPIGAAIDLVHKLGGAIELLGGKHVAMEKAVADSTKRLTGSAQAMMKAQLEQAMGSDLVVKKNKEVTGSHPPLIASLGNVGKAHKEVEMKVRSFLDLQPVLAAKLAINRAEYEKTVKELAKLQIGVENGTLGFLRMGESLEMLLELGERLWREEGLKDLPKLGASLADGSVGVNKMGEAMNAFGKDVDALSAAYKRFGLEAVKDLKTAAVESEAAFKLIRDSGTATPEQITKAWIQWQKDVIAAARAAGEEIPAEQLESLRLMEEQLSGSLDVQLGAWSAFGLDISNTIANAFTDLAFVLFEGGGSFKEKFTAMWRDIKTAAIDTFLNPIKKAFNDWIKEELASVLGPKGLGGILDKFDALGTKAKSFTPASAAGGAIPSSLPGGVGGSAPKVPSTGGGGSGGGGAGGAPGGGTLGMLGDIAGIGSLISNIISNFQLAKLEGTMNQNERNTAAISIHSMHILSRLNEFLPKLDSISTFHWTIEATWMADLLSLWENFAAAMAGVTPILPGGGPGGAGKGAMTVVIYNYGTIGNAADLHEFLDQINQEIGQGGRT